MDEYLIKFANNLKKLREERNVSLREVSEGTGISKTALSYYENAQRDPSLGAIKKLSVYFDEDINWIVGDVDTRRIKKIAN